MLPRSGRHTPNATVNAPPPDIQKRPVRQVQKQKKAFQPPIPAIGSSLGLMLVLGLRLRIRFRLSLRFSLESLGDIHLSSDFL